MMYYRLAVMIKVVPFLIPLILAATLPTAAMDYVIVDTGQDNCYNNNSEISCPQPGESFYGQDAQYNGNQPNYTLSGDGLTVYDNNTGLRWIRMPDTDGDEDLDTYDQLTWSEFLAYPATLNAQNYGGYNDWRIPSIKEQYSLIDFRGLDPSGPNPTNLVPFIDTAYFDFVYGDTTVGERLIDAQYWTSTQYVGTVFGRDTAIFGVNFADGRIKGYPRDTGPGGVSVHYARYVRGDTDYGTNDFVDNGDGTITDNATGLMWSKDDSSDSVNTGPRSGMLWGEVLAWVQQKNDDSYLGYDDWRLPNAKEMQSIVDYSRAPDATGSAAIDPIFNITEITNECYEVDYPWFWTGTTHIRADGSGPGAVYICFGRAMGYFGPPGMEAWIDVHGAGAQRSDQKDGNFSGYNYVPDGYYFGPSPQGDATRMYNYVRCVRDVTQQETPIEINMIPDESPVIVPAGGSFSFTGILINNTDQTQTPDVGIFVRIPGPSLYGPVQLFHNIPLSPFDTLISTGVIQEVPLGAIPGDYEYVAYAGDYPNNVVDSAFFPFTIMTPKNTNNKYWKLSGWFEGEDTILSTNTMLIGTYPNPFNATTTISFDLTQSADVSLTVYNLIGQEVEILLDGNMEAGKHNVNWDASFYSSGIYFYKLSAGGKVLTKRMILLK